MMTILLVIIYASFISLGLPDSLLGSAWPLMYMDLQVSVSYAGIISIVVSCGTIISSFFSVKVIRRFGTGKVTAVSVLMTAIALLGFSVSRNFIFLCLLSIPLGLGAGSVDAALNNFVALHYKARHMSWLHCFWGIGASIGPIIMSYYLNKRSWSSGFRTIGFIQCVLVVILFASLPIWKKIEKNQSDMNDDENSDLGFRELLKIEGSKYAFLAFFFYCSLESTCGLWGSSFMVFNRGISPEIAARWISLFYMGITFGRFISGFLMIKVSCSKMIQIGQGIVTVSLLLMILPLSDMFLRIALFSTGVGCAPVFPCLIHQTPEKFGAKMSQAMIGVQMACAYTSITLMPPLFGLIADNISISLYPYFLFISLIFMIVMTEGLRKLDNAA